MSEGLPRPWLALRTQEAAAGQGIWAASRRRKRQENSLPESLRMKLSPADTLALAQ